MKTIRLLAYFLALAATAHAQFTTAQISGTVTDSQGLAVADAAVDLRNQSTGGQFRFKTNELGAYLAASLQLGMYAMRVDRPGFKAYARTGIVLTANQSARVDVTLEVGAVTETITVSGQLSPVNTTTATLDTLIDDKRLVDLPLNGRNILGLAALTPAVQRVSLANGPSFGQQSVNVNGNRAYSTNIMLDGAAMYYGHRGAGLVPPPPDAVQEVKVITSGVSAEFGRGSAMISTVTRGGTNVLHGSLWDYFRNDTFDARSFFSAAVPKLRYNQFGGTVGGPIKRNKAFFFGSYQGVESRADRVVSSAFPATAEERGGNFANTRGTRPVDPTTRQPFPNGIIPRDRLDPVALKLAERIPLPNQPSGQHIAQISIPLSDQMAMARVDYDFSARDRTSFRFFLDQPVTTNPFGAGNIENFAPSETSNRTQSETLSHTHTFSPSLLLSTRGSFSRFRYSELNTVRLTLADLGSKFVTGGGPGSLPLITVTGRMNPQSAREGPRIGDNYEGGGDLSWFRGRHEFKFGASFNRTRFLIANSGRSYGEFLFNGQFSTNPMADFFLGQSSQLRQEALRNNDVHYWSYAFFAQDRWRLTRRLTINWGLRWEVYTPWRAVDGQFYALVPGQRSTVFPTAPPGILYQDDPGFPLQRDGLNIGPRIGFAFDVFGNGKTSIRGGYGITYDPLIGQMEAQNAQPFGADLLTNNVGPLTDPQRNITVPYNQPFDRQNPVFTLPISMQSSMIGRLVTPYAQNMNLTMEHEVVRDTLLQLSYVASIGRKVAIGQEQNRAIYIPGRSSTRDIDARRIFAPTFSSVTAYSTDGNSSYHGLQAMVNKRFSKGFTVLGGYAYSKSIDETSTSSVADDWFAQNPLDRRGSRGLSDTHLGHRLVISGLWELPFFRGGSGTVSRVLGGWQFAGMTSIQDGTPFTVTSGRDNTLQGINRDRPDLLGDPRLSLERPKSERIARYFDTSKFIFNREGQFGSSGRNILIGPGNVGLDLSLQKKIRLWSEASHLNLRWDVFGVTNRANFGNPGGNLSGAANFGRITSAGGSRVMQIALRVEF